MPTFNSPPTGDPTVIARLHLVAGASYRQEWHWQIIDADNNPTGDRDLSDFSDFELLISTSFIAAPVVTATNHDLQSDGQTGKVVVRVSDADTTRLQQAAVLGGATGPHSVWKGVFRATSTTEGEVTLAILEVPLRHTPGN